jgi:hypothetical protein
LRNFYQQQDGVLRFRFDFGDNEDVMNFYEFWPIHISPHETGIAFYGLDSDCDVNKLSDQSLSFYRLSDNEILYLTSLRYANFAVRSYLNQYQRFDQIISTCYPEVPFNQRKLHLIDVIAASVEQDLVEWIFLAMPTYKAVGLPFDDIKMVYSCREKKEAGLKFMPDLNRVGFNVKMVFDIMRSNEGVLKLELIHRFRDKLFVNAVMSPEEITFMASRTCDTENDLREEVVKKFAFPKMIKKGYHKECAAELIEIASGTCLVSLFQYWEDCAALGISKDDIEQIIQATYDFNFTVFHQARPVLEAELKKGLLSHQDLLNVVITFEGDKKLEQMIRKWPGYPSSATAVPVTMSTHTDASFRTTVSTSRNHQGPWNTG